MSSNVNNEVGVSAVLAAAREYVGRGLSVIPIEPRGKSPLVELKEYQERLPTADELESWFADGSANVGIVTGKMSGLIVLSFDTDEAWGKASRKGLEDETPISSVYEGTQLYCKYQPEIQSTKTGTIIDDMAVCSDGCYVIAPPSILKNGDTYSWCDDRSIAEVELSGLPEWFADSVVESPVLTVAENSDGQPKAEEPIAPLVVSDKDYLSDDATEVKSGSDEWGDPVLFGASDVPDINTNLLPGFLGDYAGAVSRNTQAPEALPVMVGLSVVSTCLQKKFVVKPYADDADFVEPVNLWTLTALKPSERKTPVFNAMMKPLKEWERSQREFLADEISRINTEREIELKRIDTLKKNAAGTDSEEDRNRIKGDIATIEGSLPDQLISPQLLTADVTAERLQQLLMDHNEKMAILNDEGGLFEILSGMYSNGKINVDVLLQAFSGSLVIIDRVSRGAYLESPALTIGLTVQPGILKSLGHGSKKRYRDNGLLARFLYGLPEGKVGTRDIRNRQPIPSAVKSAYEAGINRLLNIDFDTDEDEKQRPYVLAVSDDALEVWQDFSQDLEYALGNGGELEFLTDWGGKLPGNALRIAGCFHVVKGNDAETEIDADTMTEATNLCKILIPHALAAFGVMGKDEAVSDVAFLYEWIVSQGNREITKRDCQRNNQSRFKKVEQLDPVMRALVDRAIIRPVATSEGAGRKSESYEVNPKALRI